MCSIGEDDFGDEGGLHAMTQDEQVEGFESCAKCGAKGVLVKLKFRATECTECFLANTRHKFRAALGSSKVLPKGAEVLLLFDGSAESIVLLDMLQYAQNQNTFKRLHVDTRVIFIDESVLDVAVSVHDVKTFLSKYNFDAFIVSIWKEGSLHSFKELDSYLEYCQGESESFIESVNSFKTLTSRQDLVRKFKNRVIQNAAGQLKCNFVFSSDISTTLATELLNCISLGRGSSAAQDVSLLDDRLPNLKLVRPLRNLDAHEIKLYLEINDIKPIRTAAYGESLGANASIQNLTKQFVENLQANFPSTVSTVFRTGDKIAPPPLLHDPDVLRCAFCYSSINSNASKTLEQTQLSSSVSTQGSKLINFNHETSIVDSYLKNLCHACHNIENDII